MEIIINSYKICNNIQLNNIVNHFNIKKVTNWTEYIVLSQKQICEILKEEFEDKQILIYKYGIITFVNFNQTEIITTIKYLKDIYINIDYTLLENYNDLQTLIIENNHFTLKENPSFDIEYNKYTINILSSILAKSLEIKTLEQELDKLLDETELYLDYMYQGKFGFNIKKTSYLNTKIVKFDYKSIHRLGIYSRPIEIRKNDKLKDAYYQIYNYFEIDERLEIIKSKTHKLREISDNYISFSFAGKNVKRDIFEVLLLALFPLYSIISLLL